MVKRARLKRREGKARKSRLKYNVGDVLSTIFGIGAVRMKTKAWYSSHVYPEGFLIKKGEPLYLLRGDKNQTIYAREKDILRKVR